MLLASVLGIGSGMITIVEKIGLLADPGSSAFCDINSAIGCSPVLLAAQSSVLGPPNAAIGIVMFGMLAAAGLAGVMGTAFPRSYRWFLLGLSVFFGLFLTWYMWQVGFSIGSLCPFCVVCAGAVMAITLAAWRLATDDVAPGAGGLGGVLATARRSGLDVIVVVGWAVLIAGILAVGILV
ncbi:MAG: hypothetical protein MUF35_09910 [Candidatus Nanopelagicales bacterium]|jgi:uncharacterized membrane protein|nr:hypothetical protein [Candidatus Nanopelagicales bacterium]